MYTQVLYCYHTVEYSTNMASGKSYSPSYSPTASSDVRYSPSTDSRQKPEDWRTRYEITLDELTQTREACTYAVTNFERVITSSFKMRYNARYIGRSRQWQFFKIGSYGLKIRYRNVVIFHSIEISTRFHDWSNKRMDSYADKYQYRFYHAPMTL